MEIKGIRISIESIEQSDSFTVDHLDTFWVYQDAEKREWWDFYICNSMDHDQYEANQASEEAWASTAKTYLSADEFIALLIESGFQAIENPDSSSDQSYFIKRGTNMEIEVGALGPGGGLIFWVNEDTENDLIALEVAPSGWHLGNESDPTIVWGTSDEFTFPKMKKTVGSGLANCEVIDESDFLCPALLQIDLVSIGDFDDWHLPSVDELQLIYENIHSLGLGSLTGEQYWSSTPVFSPFVYSIIFSDGEQMMSNVQMAFSVRPIRQIRRD